MRSVVLWALAREVRALQELRQDCDSGQSAQQAMGARRVWQKRMPLVQAALARHDRESLSHLLELAARVDREGVGNVFFHKHVPDDEAFAFMRSCDVGVVPLSPGIYRYAFPSKVWTYMAADLSILAMVEEESALARMVRENDIGTVVGWNSEAAAVGKAIEQIAARIRGGDKPNPAALALYKPERARAQWLELFASPRGGGLSS